jgi:23S rRNA pseudouridine1911/1915/1917 synthase
MSGNWEPAGASGLGESAQAPEDGETESEFENRVQRLEAAAHAQRLDRVLAALAPEFSRSHLQGLIEAGQVRLDGAVVTVSSRKVKAGQRLEVHLVPPAESLAFRPEPMALDVVHEDAHVLVVNKPAGLVVHPAAGNWSGTLLNGLLARDPRAAQLPRAGIVHRLDKDTSGLMVVGRTLEAVTALVRDMAQRDIHRRYVALAHGDVGQSPSPWRRRSAVIPRCAPAWRWWRAASRPGPMSSARLSTVRSVPSGASCTPVAPTRSGSIWPIGAPLVADALYGGRPARGMQRQALHAAELAFAHHPRAAVFRGADAA